jgi:hypothetical protein
MSFVTELRKEIYMKNSIARLCLNGAIGVAFVLLPQVAKAGTTNFEVVAAPVSVDPGTCDPSTLLPKPGEVACEASESLAGPVTGDITGTLFAEAPFVVFADGHVNYVVYTTITGIVIGLGTGSFTIFEYDGQAAADGTETEKWRVVGGTGSETLAGISGNGKAQGVCNPTCTVSFTGSLRISSGQ